MDDFSVKQLHEFFSPEFPLFSDNMHQSFEGERDNFAIIPPELVHKIFSFLPLPNLAVVRQVSRRFSLLEEECSLFTFLAGILHGDKVSRSNFSCYAQEVSPLQIERETFLERKWGKKLPFFKALYKVALASNSLLKVDLSSYVIDIFAEGAKVKCSESSLAHRMCCASKAYQENNGSSLIEYYKSLLPLADEGNIDAQIAYGAFLCHDAQGNIRFHRKGVKHLTKAQEAGSVEALARLGQIYEFESEFSSRFLSYAFYFYRLAADRGNKEAQFSLGWFYNFGRGCEVDCRQAHHYFFLSAKQGHLKSKFLLGLSYLKGEGVERDYKMALDYLLQSEQMTLDSLYILCVLYTCGIGVERDFQKAENYFQKLVQYQYRKDSYHYCLGRCYLEGFGVEKNPHLAAEHFLAITNKKKRALFYLGNYFKTVKQDLESALDYYQKAADRGLPEAQYEMAKAYALGLGIEQNHDWASHYFQLLVDNINTGHINALVSDCFTHGYGTEIDIRQAAADCMDAADTGSAEAQFALCKHYAEQAGEQNNANYYFRKLSDPNHPERERNCGTRYRFIGICLHEGYGVPKDRLEAIRYFKLARALHDREADSFLT